MLTPCLGLLILASAPTLPPPPSAFATLSPAVLRADPAPTLLGLGGTPGLGAVPASTLELRLWRLRFSASVPLATDVASPLGSMSARLGLRADDRGLMVARVGYGLYLGKPMLRPRAAISLYHELDRRRLTVDERSPGAVPWSGRRSFGVEGTVFLTPSTGLTLGASMGEKSWFVGVSLVWWPRSPRR